MRSAWHVAIPFPANLTPRHDRSRFAPPPKAFHPWNRERTAGLRPPPPRATTWPTSTPPARPPTSLPTEAGQNLHRWTERQKLGRPHTSDRKSTRLNSTHIPLS